MSSYQRKRAVWVNDRGHVVGQDHHRSRISDHEVELIRALRADGMSFELLARKFEIDRRTVSRYCSGRVRGQLAVDQKLLPPPAPRAPRRRPARIEEFEDDGL